MSTLAPPGGPVQMDKKRTGSGSGRPRPVLPPPPPPCPDPSHLSPERESLDSSADKMDKHSSQDLGRDTQQRLCVNDIASTSGQGHMSKHDSDSKSRNCSTSSADSGGKSPRPNFRKSRPAPLPPKPKAKSEKHTAPASSNVPLKVSSTACITSSENADNSDADHASVNSDSITSILASKGQLARNKSIMKPSAPPPPLPPQKSVIVVTRPAVNGEQNVDAVLITKPAILSPKPKIKPCAPPPPPPAPPPPPNQKACLRDESSEAPPDAEGTADDLPTENDISDLSDIMKDVLGVIDRKDVSNSRTDMEVSGEDVIATDRTMVCENGEMTSERVPNLTQEHSSNNDTIVLNEDTTYVDQSSGTENTDSVGVKQINGHDADVTTALTIEIPQTPVESHPTPPVQKPSVAHHRGANSPRRPVRRRKTALGLMLCCGIGKAFLRDKNSPPFELPLRTEGTLPRGQNLVHSASLSSDLMRSSHSPKKLEQSDVTAPTSHVSADNITTTSCSGDVPSQQNDVIRGRIDEKDVATVSGDVTGGKTRKRDLIDVLCESEKPISINKLQGDNKDLVVTSESTSSSLTSIDVTNRPVVHGVKLVKVEKSATFTALTSGHNPSRPTTPRLLKTTEIPNDSNHLAESPVEIGLFSNPSEVVDIKLRKNSQSRMSSRDPEKVRSQSMEDLSCLVVDLEFDLADHIKRAEGYRSSFIGEDVKSQPALTRAPGEVQTLLKHTKEDEDKVYALPQPACYGDDTLKAVKLITDKYDTLERWKARAVSFRGDDTVRRDKQNVDIKIASASRQNSTDSKTVDVIPEVFESDVTDGVTEVTSDPNVNTADLDNSAVLEESGDEIKALELSREEISRIRLFYGSCDTVVASANSVVDLMLSTKEVQNASDVKEWAHAHSGVPVLVLNTGNGRRRRKLTITLADRDTSFPLWSDTINYLSQYEALAPTLHTMHLSGSLMKIAAFQFHSEVLADDFVNQFKEITKDPNDDLWKVSIDSKKSKKRRQASKVPVKGDISQPIQFDHVTRVSAHDQNLAVTLGEFIPKSSGSGKVVTNNFRQRAYSG